LPFPEDKRKFYLRKSIARKKRLCHNGVMKKERRIIWKIYALVFSTVTLANFLWLVYPEAEPYIFYHILMAWTKFYAVHYYLAVFKCLIALVCLVPLFAFSFNRQSRSPQIWQWLFVIRIVSDVVGSFYEYLFVKSSYHMVLGYGLTTTGAMLLPVLPSYIAHYLYAFQYAFQKKN
jgi:hypothetical protein